MLKQISRHDSAHQDYFAFHLNSVPRLPFCLTTEKDKNL